MIKRRIGKTDLLVHPIGIGGNVFGWTVDEKKSLRILDELYDNGLNFIDTADVYSIWKEDHVGGESENLIGKWLNINNKRENLIIATKVGADMGRYGKGLSKKHIMSSINNSLRRLRTDYIDLYLTHYDDKDTSIEETLEAYQSLVQQGKVRYIGASNISPDRLVESLRISNTSNLPLYQNIQPEYNLFSRELFETKYQSISNDYNLGITPYFALASGFLTGKYRNIEAASESSRSKWLSKYFNERGFKILQAMDKIAHNRNIELATLAIAWLISKSNITSAITSVSSLSQIKTTLLATEIVLSKSEIFELNEASSY